jgi:hypothetical protein
MQLTPEMIDALVMQLKQAITLAEHLPPKVQQTGQEFLAALDEWSDQLRKKDGHSAKSA